MANPAVTYTFSNSTTADATQVNQNFTDLINGATDGTKDYSISALTVAGAATLNGNITLGNASADDLTITASLASSLAIKTTATYNIGSSTLGLLSMYLGNSTFTTRLLSAATSSWTFTFPVTGGTAKYLMQTDGSGTTSWVPVQTNARDSKNIGITATVAASAMTVGIVGADGNALSATNYALVAFRSATSATGTPTERTATAITSVVIPSGATMGTINAVAATFNVWLIDNAGTIEIAVANQGAVSTDGRITTVAIDTASDSNNVFYSNSARTNVAARLVGAVVNTQATAGTYATSPSSILLDGCPLKYQTASTEWATYTLSITGSTSNPTKANVKTADNAIWRRSGDTMHIKYEYSHASNTGAAAGSGVYRFSIPSGYTIDYTKMFGGGGSVMGLGYVLTTGFDSLCRVAVDSTLSGIVYLYAYTGSSAQAMGTVGSTAYAITGAAVNYSLDFSVPIVGWFSHDWQ